MIIKQRIFEENAQRYFDANIPVIPLAYQDKKPLLADWSQWAEAVPDKDLQKHWIEGYGHGNIGIPLGAASGLQAVDLDALDPEVLRKIVEILPPTDWVRRGQKGMVMMYRYNPNLKARKFKNDKGEMILELLSKGNQVVIPPSIHPKTFKPYTANKELLDAIPNLVSLPDDFEEMLVEKLGKNYLYRQTGVQSVR